MPMNSPRQVLAGSYGAGRLWPTCRCCGAAKTEVRGVFRISNFQGLACSGGVTACLMAQAVASAAPGHLARIASHLPLASDARAPLEAVAVLLCGAACQGDLPTVRAILQASHRLPPLTRRAARSPPPPSSPRDAAAPSHSSLALYPPL
jgi:hypothetical protein